ncbi:MAG: transglycosylase SLT domain-containing protein [Desulfococcaceae bacterium]
MLRPFKGKGIRNAAIAAAAAGLLACEKPAPTSPLETVLETGRITLVTRYGPTTYFSYRDRPDGFEYQLARAFADYLGVELAVHVAPGWTDIRRALSEIPGAFAAPGLPLPGDGIPDLAATAPYLTLRHHIILGPAVPEAVESPADLAGQTVHLPARSAAEPVLEALRRDGLAVEVRIHPDLPGEELIRQVAAGTLPATAAPGHVALLNRRYYPETRIAAPVGPPRRLRWLAPEDGTALLARMEEFFVAARRTGRFQEIYDRHFDAPPPPQTLAVEPFLRGMAEKAGPFLPHIQSAAAEHGFDWRLIAAQIYQESRFRPDARSPAGAVGLMQLMPDTARNLGVADIRNPAENIAGGVRHLRKLYNFFDGAAGEADRLRMALAAYNVGQGHLLDARNLARRQGRDPERWAVLAETLPLLRDERYYRDALYGYCRGTEPVNYVRRITAYADVLRREAWVEATAKNP